MQSKYKVLIGCEESQAITKEFRELGFEAYSCDLLPCSGGHPEWHLQMDVFKAIDIVKPTLAVFHPPCTMLAGSGMRMHLKMQRQKKRDRPLEVKHFQV